MEQYIFNKLKEGVEFCTQLLFTDQLLMLVQYEKYSTKSPDNNQWFLYNRPIDPCFTHWGESHVSWKSKCTG